MSVTFSIESIPTGHFVVECMDEETFEFFVVACADSQEGIAYERELHMAACEECTFSGCYTKGVWDLDDDFDVNVANTNGRQLLIRLGIEDGDLVGRMDADSFMGAVMLANLAMTDDSGIKPFKYEGAGATMIDCGLRPGYFADTFDRLFSLGAEAKRLGREVVWA